MATKTFSIILPVRNGGEYVKDCISSILAQTCSDFELVVLDNASTDGTREWITALAHPQIRLIPSNEALSIEGNWARIRNISKNTFITLIGHDDLLEPHYLAEMKTLIEAYPDAGLYQSHFNYIDGTGKYLRACKPMDIKETAPELLQSFLRSEADIMGTGFMMRAADYDLVGGIPTYYPSLLFADLELWIRLTNPGYKATSPRTCFSYRLHQSTTKTSSDQTILLAMEQFVRFMMMLQANNQQFATVIEANGIGWIRQYARSLSHRLLRTPKSLRKGFTINHILANTKQYADWLIPGNHYQPGNDLQIRAARLIDATALTRGLFRWYKKISA